MQAKARIRLCVCSHTVGDCCSFLPIPFGCQRRPYHVSNIWGQARGSILGGGHMTQHEQARPELVSAGIKLSYLSV